MIGSLQEIPRGCACNFTNDDDVWMDSVRVGDAVQLLGVKLLLRLSFPIESFITRFTRGYQNTSKSD